MTPQDIIFIMIIVGLIPMVFSNDKVIRLMFSGYIMILLVIMNVCI